MTEEMVPQDPYQLMDAMDDRAIVEQMEGRVTDAWVYAVNQGGRTVTGLSAAGVEEAARLLARNSKGTEVLRELEAYVEKEDDLEARFIAKAGRFTILFDQGTAHEVLMDTAIRGKRVSKYYANGEQNPHWFEQGLTKAVRNAKLALLPETLISEMVRRAQKLQRTKELTADDGRVAPAPSSPPEGIVPTASVQGITKPQISAIRALLRKLPNEEAQQRFLSRFAPQTLRDGEIHLGGLSKQDASRLIEALQTQ